MASFNAGAAFSTGVANDVTADKLGLLITNATPTPGFIQDRTAESIIATNDTLLIGDASDSSNLKRMTVADFRSAATFGTTTSTAATITSGTITTLNSTTGTITTGVIPTLTSTTLITTGTGTAASPAIVPTGDTNTGIFFPAADTIAFSEGGAEAMRIDSSGNVGIGTTNPSGRLHVVAATNTNFYTSSGTTQYQLNSILNGNNANLYYGVEGSSTGRTDVGETLDNASFFGSRTAHPVQLISNNAARMTIDSSGNVGIGTTSPASKLDVYGVGNFQALELGKSGRTGNRDCVIDMVGDDTYSDYGFRIIRNSTGSNAESVLTSKGTGGLFLKTEEAGPIVFQTTNTERLRIDSSGSLILAGSTAQKASGTTWSNPSDIRIKKNIRDYEKGLDSLMQVRVREWEYNGKAGTVADTKSMGVVADEVQTILPDTVNTYKAKLNPEDEEDSDIKKFDATEITWLLVKAVQELSAKVTALESA